MRQKELRIALVCYGGISLAVYMHGVTKELWKLARASCAYHARDTAQGPVERAYLSLFEKIEDDQQIKLRVLPDIVTGASAGGINAVFLAQAIHSGQSLEPLTKLWLKNADVKELVAPEAAPFSRFTKFWAMPIVWYLLSRPDSAVSESVAPETRAEVRSKVAHLIRCRWFAPPFSGSNFSKLIFNALGAMADQPSSAPLLPPGHPLDLAVTATDFRGHRELLRLNSPPIVEESEHRLTIDFRSRTPSLSGRNIAHPCELTMAARATASFPGAFPVLRLGEIDGLLDASNVETPWTTRDDFLQRIMPTHVEHGTTEMVSFIDGSVLVNAPFDSAIAGLRARPAQREVDRRIVYIDPRPDRVGPQGKENIKPVGFFAAILGSLSTIPREQPIRDNLEALEAQSYEAEKLRQIVNMLRPEIEAAVEKLFGRTLFLDKPTPKRLQNWRMKAQQAAAERAGYTYHAYAQAKFSGIIERIAALVCKAAPNLGKNDKEQVARRLRLELDARGMRSLLADERGASREAIAFLRAHDLAFRMRRLRLLARRLSREWEADPELADISVQEARDAVYLVLSLYFTKEQPENLGEEFPQIASEVMSQPGRVLDYLAKQRDLPGTDTLAEEELSRALGRMSKSLRRRVLLAYLGFPFYDVATLPLVRNEGMTEFDPVKVDRISPEDALSIRAGGTSATLRGIEFFNFGGFFSRAYRENDYLWGRMHGAERMVDLVCSTIPQPYDEATIRVFKRDVFLAICDEEAQRGNCATELIETLREEICERLENCERLHSD